MSTHTQITSLIQSIERYCAQFVTEFDGPLCGVTCFAHDGEGEIPDAEIPAAVGEGRPLSLYIVCAAWESKYNAGFHAVDQISKHFGAPEDGSTAVDGKIEWALLLPLAEYSIAVAADGWGTESASAALTSDDSFSTHADDEFFWDSGAAVREQEIIASLASCASLARVWAKDDIRWTVRNLTLSLYRQDQTDTAPRIIREITLIKDEEEVVDAQP